jgi:hypothetical protein
VFGSSSERLDRAQLELLLKLPESLTDPEPVEPSTFKITVSGRSKPARAGRMETSHFEERIALSAVETAQRRDESTQRELATFHHDFGGAWLVPPADCA